MGQTSKSGAGGSRFQSRRAAVPFGAGRAITSKCNIPSSVMSSKFLSFLYKKHTIYTKITNHTNSTNVTKNTKTKSKLRHLSLVPALWDGNCELFSGRA